MAISIGDKIPAVDTLSVMSADGPQGVTSEDVFSGKKVVLFALPGAFTPTCSAAHLPGFVANADKIKAKGVDTIACMATNDAFVMDAWGKSQNAEEITMLADGNGDLASALGLTIDLTARGMGVRAKRFAMIVDDGVVKAVNVEESPAEHDVSSAESMLSLL